MNMYSNDYLKNQIATASREQLLIMFYDGAIRFTAQAKIAIENNNIEGRNYAIQKACAIVTELAATLDHKIGGKIAEDLDALYAFMLKQFNNASVKNDISPLIAIENILSDLRQTWVEAIQIVKVEKRNKTVPIESQEYKPLSVAL